MRLRTMDLFARRKLHRLPTPAALMVAALWSVLVAAPGTAFAGSRLHPGVFAVSASTFPTGSQVVRSGIETNRQLLRDDLHHFGLPPSELGRETGYYMNAVEGDPAAPSRPYTAYLVSIFRSARLANIAYEDRFDTWFAANYYTSPATVPIHVGDGGSAALFHSLNLSSAPYSELFFRRGAVLVEVYQGGATPPTAERLHAFYTLALTLDGLASRHRLGT